MNSTEICNLALSYLGQGRINSLEDATEEGKKCKVHYDHDRRRMLLAYPWGFARRIMKLALYDAHVPGWAYAYAYPPACIAVTFVYDEEHARVKEENRQDFEIVTLGGGRKAIASDTADAYAEYTEDVRDTGTFSEEFAEGFSHLLAASIAMGVTGNANIVAQHLQLAQQSIMTAKYYAALEKEKRTRYPEKYANARFS